MENLLNRIMLQTPEKLNNFLKSVEMSTNGIRCVANNVYKNILILYIYIIFFSD